MSFSSSAYSGWPRIRCRATGSMSWGLLAGARRLETTASPVTNRSRLAPARAVVSRRCCLALHFAVRAAYAPASGRSVKVSASYPLSLTVSRHKPPKPIPLYLTRTILADAPGCGREVFALFHLATLFAQSTPTGTAPAFYLWRGAMCNQLF